MAIKDGPRPGQIGVTLIVKDPAAAAGFYRDVLEADPRRRATADAHRRRTRPLLEPNGRGPFRIGIQAL